MSDIQTATKPAEADTGFQIVLGDPTSGQVPATTTSTDVASSSNTGLTYHNATAAELAKMDEIIKKIDLTDPETIITLGDQERETLASIADQVLDSVQPSVKLAFAEALNGLIGVIRSNSLDEVKKRVTAISVTHGLASAWKGLMRQDTKLDDNKKLIANFMTDISGTRKTISEMTDKLHDQQTELNKNYDRINQLGRATVTAAQDMQVVRAAVAEYIRRIETGENPILDQLKATADATGRPDDSAKVRTAQSNWNLIRTVDNDLLGSIGVYDMNIGQLAFTKEANYQNRMQTRTAMTTSIAEWKTHLAIFAAVTTENAAAQLLGAVSKLTEESVKKNADMFDTLVDSVTQRAAKGTYNLRQIIEAQAHMADKLASVGGKVEADFAQMAADKKDMEVGLQKFRKNMAEVYSKKSLLAPGVQAGRPVPQIATKPGAFDKK